MTPLAVLGWIKEGAIVAALAWVVWFLVHSGRDHERVRELQAIQTAMAANEKAHEHALSELQADLAAVPAIVREHSAPIVVRVPVRVPALPATPSGHPAAGPVDAGPGIDVRPGVRAFEEKYERALAECRSALAQWPQ